MDPTQKLLNKGEKVQVSFNGNVFEVECIESSVVGFIRTYRVRFSDGSEKTFSSYELSNRLN